MASFYISCSCKLLSHRKLNWAHPSLIVQRLVRQVLAEWSKTAMEQCTVHQGQVYKPDPTDWKS